MMKTMLGESHRHYQEKKGIEEVGILPTSGGQSCIPAVLMSDTSG